MLEAEQRHRAVKPSDNLVKAHLEKSRNALKSMEINAQASLAEWAVSTSYYAKYFAVYALLSKIGVKCEIHDCTITMFEYLFCDNVPREIVKDLRNSKADRVEMQYYTREISVDLGGRDATVIATLKSLNIKKLVSHDDIFKRLSNKLTLELIDPARTNPT